MSGVITRLAKPSDAPAIVTVLADAAPTNVLPMTIYGCEGISAFIRAEIEAPRTFNERVFVVADDHGALVGAAELRKLEGALFLNQIAVASSARAHGIGRSVLAHGIEAASDGELWSEVRLDVFEENATARLWYERLGFVEVHRTEWWEIRLDWPTEQSPISRGRTYISGFAQSRVCHEAFGFSEFTLTTQMGRYAVGRLGAADLRIRQPDAIEDADLLDSLRCLSPGARLLALVPPGRFDRHRDLPARQISTTRRMACSTSVLLESLHRHGKTGMA